MNGGSELSKNAYKNRNAAHAAGFFDEYVGIA